MTYHLETIAILEKSASVLEGLAPEFDREEDAWGASAKILRAANALRVEPLYRQDIENAKGHMREAKEPLIRIYNEREALSEEHQGWLETVIQGWQGCMDLLDGLAAFHKQVTLEPKGKRMGQRLRDLLPATWWGSR